MSKTTRKIQKTGNSSYTVSVPGEWVEKIPYSEDPKVTFHRLGEVLIMSRTSPWVEERTVTTKGKELPTVYKEIKKLYVEGYEKICIDLSGIESDKIGEIMTFMRSLKGMEVLGGREGEMVARDTLDLSEFPPEDTLKRTLSTSESAIETAVEAYLEDEKRAGSVRQMLAETERLLSFSSRFCSILFTNPDRLGELDFTGRDLVLYSSFTRDLHNVTREAVRISEASGHNLPEQAATEVNRLKYITKEALSDAVLYAIGDIEDIDLSDGRNSYEDGLVNYDAIPYSSIEDGSKMEYMMVLSTLSNIYSRAVTSKVN